MSAVDTHLIEIAQIGGKCQRTDCKERASRFIRCLTCRQPLMLCGSHGHDMVHARDAHCTVK